MGQRALDFCKDHPDSDPQYVVNVERLKALLVRAKELELQEKMELDAQF